MTMMPPSVVWTAKGWVPLFSLFQLSKNPLSKPPAVMILSTWFSLSLFFIVGQVVLKRISCNQNSLVWVESLYRREGHPKHMTGRVRKVREEREKQQEGNKKREEQDMVQAQELAQKALFPFTASGHFQTHAKESAVYLSLFLSFSLLRREKANCRGKVLPQEFFSGMNRHPSSLLSDRLIRRAWYLSVSCILGTWLQVSSFLVSFSF